MNELDSFLQELKQTIALQLASNPIKPPVFNVFSALDLETDEVRGHSQFIYALLKLKDSEGKPLFLQYFLETIGCNAVITNKVKIYKEKGKIDLQIRDTEWAMIIENKIYAEDKNEQLSRYYEKIKPFYNSKPNAQIFILYLSLDGKKPEGHSNKNLGFCEDKTEHEKILCISYYTDIISWINRCIKETVEEPFLRETLLQYRYIIQKITGQLMNTNTVDTIRNLLKEQKIYEIISPNDWNIGYISLKHHTQHNMWANLKEEFGKILPNCELIEKTDSYVLANNSKKIWDFSNNQRGSKNYYYGLTWKIMEITEKEYLWTFKIQFNGNTNKLYMGIRLSQQSGDKIIEIKGKTHKEELFEKYKKLADDIEYKSNEKDKYTFDEKGSNESWLCYYYIKLKVDENTYSHFNFTNFNTKAIRSIVQDNDCKIFAVEVAIAAKYIIDEFKKKNNIHSSSN